MEATMSADREMDHLENMSGMNGSRHYNHSSAYAETDEQAAEDELRERLAAHHSQLYTTAVSAMRERGRPGRETHPRRFAGLAGLFRGVLGVPALHVAPGAAVIRAFFAWLFLLACVWGWLHLGKERQAREWDAERLQIWLRRMWRSGSGAPIPVGKVCHASTATRAPSQIASSASALGVRYGG